MKEKEGYIQCRQRRNGIRWGIFLTRDRIYPLRDFTPVELVQSSLMISKLSHSTQQQKKYERGGKITQVKGSARIYLSGKWERETEGYVPSLSIINSSTVAPMAVRSNEPRYNSGALTQEVVHNAIFSSSLFFSFSFLSFRRLLRLLSSGAHLSIISDASPRSYSTSSARVYYSSRCVR